MNFFNLYDQGFARVAAVTLPVHPGDPQANADEILAAAKECHDMSVAVAVFPELSLTGYSLDDLLMQDTLLQQVDRQMARIVSASRDINPILIVGLPLRTHSCELFNCAAVIHRGTVHALVPKHHLANYREFYEKRVFNVPSLDAPPTFDCSVWTGDDTPRVVTMGSAPITVPGLPGLVLGVEICEDLWVPDTPSTHLALQGANVIVNLSASPVTVGRAAQRELLVQSTSARLLCAYVYAAAGLGESSTDLSWDGQALIYEAGERLAAGPRFAEGRHVTVADVDLETLRAERTRQNSFADNARQTKTQPFTVGGITGTEFTPPQGDLGLLRPVDRFPFVPDDPQLLEQDCFEAYNIQVTALAQRLKSIGNPKIVIGVSGGLDSTHALLVAAKAMDRLGRPRTDILGYTMPGFATSDSTKSKAWRLGESLGVSFEEIDIRPAAEQMLADMGHPYAQGAAQYDVTFENVQAGLRTDYLFRLANHHGGIVLGTGDLSELALGWCTYGVGDHMSHYGVNAGVPKTMIQHLIRWEASTERFSAETNAVLLEILDQEISPELVPSGADGQLQSTQDRIGPYNLQDFTLFHVLRRGARPSKIAFLAWHAWSDAARGQWPAGFPEEQKCAYTLDEIVTWERLFLRRFFTQQFKRSALPNGPKVTAGGSLSPRGDWRMPSDASSAAWLSELNEAVAGLVADAQ